MPVDYGDIVAIVLADKSGNGHRLEAAARLAHAWLYREAERAREDVRGVPLSILSNGEAFYLQVAPHAGLAIAFERKAATLEATAVGLPTAALEGQEQHKTWTPGEIALEKLQAEVEGTMGWAVRCLAKAVALMRR